MNGAVRGAPLAKNLEPDYNEMASIIIRKEQHRAQEIDAGWRVKWNRVWLEKDMCS